MRTNRKNVSILLDSNIWRYISDLNAGKELLKESIKHKVDILIAPSVLYEALRTKDVDLRDRLVTIMTEPSWKRLMPEAFVACQELRHEIRRVRPQWIRPGSKAEWSTRVLLDWRRKKGGFWDRARFSTEREANNVNRSELGRVDQARKVAKEHQELLRENDWDYSHLQLDKLAARFPDKPVGWKGDNIEPWRIAGMNEVNSGLSSVRNNPFQEWLSSEVDVKALPVESSSWNEFWFYDIAAENMPSFWLRWAIETLQSLRKITAGTPCDSQLGAYLHRCDYFISADRTFIQIIHDCRRYAPIPVCAPILVPGGPAALQALFEFFSKLKVSRK